MSPMTGSSEKGAKLQTQGKTLTLIDGSGYIFRAYFAVRSLSRSDGLPTNAVYGFSNMLLKTLQQHPTDYLAIAFDRKGPTFRNELYADYKANRPPPPEDLVPQFDLIQRAVEAFGIKKISKIGYEADDVLGTLAKLGVEAGMKVNIITGDKDLMQLVTHEIHLIDEMRSAKKGGSSRIDPQGVFEKMGVGAEHVIDLLAMAGDASDNVPGVKGIGPKSAVALIEEFGTLEQIYENIDLIKRASWQNKLREGAELAKLSKDLVTIRTDVDIRADWNEYKYESVDAPSLRTFFSEMEFRRLQNHPLIKLEGGSDNSSASAAKGTPNSMQLDDSVGKTSGVSTRSVRVNRVTSVDTWLEALEGFVSKHESPSENENENENEKDNDKDALPIVGVVPGFGLACGLVDTIQAISFQDINSVETKAVVNLKEKLSSHVRKGTLGVLALKPLLEANMFRVNADDFQACQDGMRLFDLMAYTLDPEAFGGSWTKFFKAFCGRERKALSEVEIDAPFLEEVFKHKKARSDAAAALASISDLSCYAHQIQGRLSENEKLSDWVCEVEIPSLFVIDAMESAGISLNTETLASFGVSLRARLTAIESNAYEAAGETFNLQSPAQLGDILFNRLGLPAPKKTKTGYSTDASVLEKLKDAHPLPGLMLEHRVLAKLLNTYVDALPNEISSESGRVHTSFQQTKTATGRLSSTKPNLQNIPIRGDEGRRIRESFVASKGNKLIALDYSQIELRILAHITEDATLCETFERDEDVHTRTASEIFGKSQESVSRDERGAAKSINFGLMYGMGAHKLAGEIGVTRREAKEYIERYFARYPGIRAWQSRTLEAAKMDGFVETMTGRVRWLPGLSSTRRMEVAHGERLAINTPIQGSAADVVKLAMIKVARALRTELPECSLLLQVHDELIIEAPDAQAQACFDLCKASMMDAYPLAVPLKVDGAIGDRWADIH